MVKISKKKDALVSKHCFWSWEYKENKSFQHCVGCNCERDGAESFESIYINSKQHFIINIPDLEAALLYIVIAEDKVYEQRDKH